MFNVDDTLSRALDREKTGYTNDRDQQRNQLRRHENELHELQLRESDLKSRVRDQATLEERIKNFREELIQTNSRTKVCPRSPISWRLYTNACPGYRWEGRRDKSAAGANTC